MAPPGALTEVEPPAPAPKLEPKGRSRSEPVLAWHRTSLALVLAGLVLTRLALHLERDFAVYAAMLAVGIPTVVMGVTSARQVETSIVAEPTFDSVLLDGKVPTAVSVLICLLSIGELSLVVLVKRKRESEPG